MEQTDSSVRSTTITLADASTIPLLGSLKLQSLFGTNTKVPQFALTKFCLESNPL